MLWQDPNADVSRHYPTRQREDAQRRLTSVRHDPSDTKPAKCQFKYQLVHLSFERTMMSWLRTTTALIGFGFAIEQYVSHLEQAPASGSA